MRSFYCHKSDKFLRDITGSLPVVTSYAKDDIIELRNNLSGAFYRFDDWKIPVGNYSGQLLAGKAHFSANSSQISPNPMGGHANGVDIHPYDIAMLPLIAF